MKKFALLSVSRSGTSLLIETLGTHPDVLAHGEVFHEKWEWHIRPEFHQSHDITRRERDPVGFVEEILTNPFGRRVVGLKLWRPQSEPACDYLLADTSVIKIIMERENKLAQFSSSLLARQTDVWNVRTNVQLAPRDTKVPFKAEGFARFLAHQHELFSYYRAHAKGQVIELSYRQAARLEIEPVKAALDLREFPLQHQMQRLNGADILDRFESRSHAAIRSELDRLGRPEWTREDL